MIGLLHVAAAVVSALSRASVGQCCFELPGKKQSCSSSGIFAADQEPIYRVTGVPRDHRAALSDSLVGHFAFSGYTGSDGDPG